MNQGMKKAFNNKLPKRAKLKLKDLLAKISKKNIHGIQFNDRATGKEIW